MMVPSLSVRAVTAGRLPRGCVSARPPLPPKGRAGAPFPGGTAGSPDRAATKVPPRPRAPPRSAAEPSRMAVGDTTGLIVTP